VLGNTSVTYVVTTGTIDAPSMTATGGFYREASSTVAGLATIDPFPQYGDRAVVTDATACTFLGALTGGASTKCPAVYTGSWVGG